ncbi:hypothetical protein KCU64_g17911, partial [Aureobasidium melanogenum]
MVGTRNVASFGVKRSKSNGNGRPDQADIELLSDQAKLHSTHDIAETIQYTCEGLTEVDRCFVTCDYTSSGPSGHAADSERV